jgi:multidrug efflux pump subunit AcrB
MFILIAVILLVWFWPLFSKLASKVMGQTESKGTMTTIDTMEGDSKEHSNNHVDRVDHMNHAKEDMESEPETKSLEPQDYKQMVEMHMVPN